MNWPSPAANNPGEGQRNIPPKGIDSRDDPIHDNTS